MFTVAQVSGTFKVPDTCTLPVPDASNMFQALQHEIHKNRIFGLDILRSLAILMVLVEHGMLLLKPVFNYLDFMKLGGFWGVELFFVLSGFLIGGILLKIYDSPQNFDRHALFSFWKRRWFRTLPNYYLILLFNLAVLWWNGEALLQYASFFIFSQSINQLHPPFFEEAWSLAIEEWFYILFPLILLILNLLLSPILKTKNRFLISILLVLSYSLIMRYVEVCANNPTWDSGIRKMVFLRLDAILTGVLFAWWHHYYFNSFQVYKKWFLALAIMLLSLSFYIYNWSILATGMQNASFFAKTFYFNLTSLGFAFCLPYFNEIKRQEKLSKLAKFITLISVVSYSMYLLHYSVVLRFIYQIIDWNTSVLTAVIFYTLYLFLTVVFSVLLYCFFEKPVMDRRERVF